MLNEASFELKETPLHYGRLKLPSQAKALFPDVMTSVKVTIYFDEGNEPVDRIYNGKWGVLYGLRRWFRQNSAAPGDMVVVQNLGQSKFRLKLIKARIERKTTDSF